MSIQIDPCLKKSLQPYLSILKLKNQFDPLVAEIKANQMQEYARIPIDGVEKQGETKDKYQSWVTLC